MTMLAALASFSVRRVDSQHVPVTAFLRLGMKANIVVGNRHTDRDLTYSSDPNIISMKDDEPEE